MKLKFLVSDCNFKDIDNMIRDRIVFRLYLEKIWEKLINVGKEFKIDKVK